MSESTYQDPKFTLSKIYTRGGDKGQTSLVNGRRVAKDDPKVEAYGAVDELIARVGVARVTTNETGLGELGEFAGILLRVQHELFNLGSLLATDPGKIGPKQPRIAEADVIQLEKEIDEMNAELPRLNSFTLPGGCRLDAELHLCRTGCREAERRVITLSSLEEVDPFAVTYLNRLSDAFFVWSRWACCRIGAQETLWQPSLASSGKV
ncbi:MAG: cob(I)yrinic acid a,c-diamide adenosyltransferase [Acidobacteria bacterium]|nr:cob(I)yrinic acid a,c-diamide adenosyltransferase [Acidobacteriota bacterium]MDA1233544.1 cob(I)yrinic acid a,c-diamide adenosyltransferase [Acidobacteriota bacterium]